jgi:hypothetical protein
LTTRSLTRGNGGVTGYNFDAASRLTGLAHTVPAGSGANCQFHTLGYNPAGQLVSRAVSKAPYEWPPPAPVTDSYMGCCRFHGHRVKVF